MTKSMSITGIGVPGSFAHVVTNKNMSAKNKVKCFKEQFAVSCKPVAAVAMFSVNLPSSC